MGGGCRSREFLIAATVALGLICSLAGRAGAQPAVTAVVAPGNAAVTGFSGAVPPVQIAPGNDPGEQTFIDLNGPSLRAVDLRSLGGPLAAQLAGAPKPFTASAASIGQVFGVALDDHSPPNIYVAATSAYGLPIVAPASGGQSQHVKTGAPHATFMPGLWGPNGGPGSIWKIDGANGAVSLFANVMLGSRANSGPGLGGLAFDPASKSLFVADRETGFIHRFGMNGRELHRYGHGVTGREAQGLPPVHWKVEQRLDVTSPQFDSTQPATWNYAVPERRIFGLAVYERRLYYAVADGLQIWSIGLKPDGSFGSDAVIELAVPAAEGPTEISKIAFDEQGRMYLAERPAPTGAFDFEALAVPATGRVLRYSLIGTTTDGRHIWQEQPDQYAIGFPDRLRNGNGGVAIGYNYDYKGEIITQSCGGFMWSTGEDLRNSPDAGIAARLSPFGLLHVDGLQGNGTWHIRRDDEPPFESYFIAYVDEYEDAAAHGHMGDVTIMRACTPPPQPYRPRPIRQGRPGVPGGGVPPGGAGPPGGGFPPSGGGPPPPGGCQPNQLRDVNSGACLPGCPRPGIQVNGKCCSVATLATDPACSNSNCPAGQSPIGPSNYCCNSSQIYTNASGAQACCSGPLVNGQCQPSPPPNCQPGSTNPQCCPSGYVSSGTSCCLASQLTITGVCCPTGQVPSAPGKNQCVPFIPIHIPSVCCPGGQIPVAGPQACCALANVTSNGICCSQPVDPNDRGHCPAQIQSLPVCAAGYAKMPDGSCCSRRFVSDDGKTCNTRQAPCSSGEFRDASGACVPLVAPPPIGLVSPPKTCPPGEMLDGRAQCAGSGGRPPRCPPGEVLDRRGRCVGGGAPPPRCLPSQVLDRRGRCVGGGSPPPRCLPGEVVGPRGRCVNAAPQQPGRQPPGFMLPGRRPPRFPWRPGGGVFVPGGGFRR